MPSLVSVRISLLLCYGLFLSKAVAQVGSVSVPPPVVSEKAEQILLQPDATPCDNACATLSHLLPSQLFLAKTGDFALWDAQQGSLTPACRVEPASAEDVSKILKTVVGAGCHFAIKSGGHARTAGASNADGGVTIDLVRMGNVVIEEDRKSVKVGAGARWKEVYEKLEPEGLMVIGGRVADVGVGGLLLGGGISFYSARHGWACDSVISYKIVLPDGTITTVTHKSHPDLYFALRGAGSSNFGIVTEFTLEAFKPSNPAGLWDMNKMYDWSAVPALLSEQEKLYTSGVDDDYDIGGFNVFSYFKPYEMYLSIIRLLHTKHNSTETWPEVFAPYEEIEGLPNSTTLLTRTFSDITIEIANLSPYHYRNIYGTFTYKPSMALDTKILAFFQEEVEKVKHIDGLQPNIIMHPLSPRMISQMTKNGGNALGISTSDGPLVILNLAWRWNSAQDDEEVYASYYRFMAKSEDAAKEMGLWHRFKYINYAEGTQDVYSGYGDANLARLKEIQRAVDPDGIFTAGGLCGGYFKLNKHGDDLVVPVVPVVGGKEQEQQPMRKSEL